MKISGSAAAWRIVTLAGFGASRSASTAAYCASEPCRPPTPPVHAVDVVAGPEFGHADADGFDRPGEIDAEDRGQRLARMRGLAGAYLEVERVDRARCDPDQDLPGLESRRGTDAIRNAARWPSRTAASMVFSDIIVSPV